jgi:DNA-binding response OmpR family regulator
MLYAASQATAARAASEFMEEDDDRRLLIVDDEADLREIFSCYLGEDYLCDTAASADEALARMACESYALVISDVMMPGRNGVELLRSASSTPSASALTTTSSSPAT